MFQPVGTQPKSRATTLLASMILATFLLLALFQTISAQGDTPQPFPPELGGSEKLVDLETANPGSTLEYTIIISNSGNLPATDVAMTDTLPAELSYVPSSLAVVGGGLFGEANGTITWTGTVNNNAQIELTFSAIITESVSEGQIITNTATITGTGTAIDISASTTIITDTTSYDLLPFVARPFPIPAAPVLNPIDIPTSNNGYQTFLLTASWGDVSGDNVTYVVQTARQADFSDAVDHNVGSDTSFAVEYAGSTNVAPFYFRVRAIDHGLSSVWSNVQSQFGVYYDSFDNPSGWSIRRQDTDDVDNDAYYQNGNFVLKIRGRWDYAIAAPMARAVPWSSYSMSSRVRFDPTVDNLHSYGFVFGGDWNGQACPNADYSSCFNHYYRLIVVWYGSPNQLKIQLKRIDYHDPDSNVGRGVTLIAFQDVNVGDPDSWNDWRIDVRENGQISIYVDGQNVANAFDTDYVGGGTYYGVFAATDEYSGAEPWFDWYRVNPLP